MTTARRLCLAADIRRWSSRKVPEQIRAQQSLAEVVRAACRAARLPEEIAQVSGDGVLLLAPTGIDESVVIPAFVHGLTVALAQDNRMLADTARIRLRLALTAGSVSDGETGFSGQAIIECFRLLDSAPVRTALEDYPNADLAMIVSDHLYQDVIRHDFGSLRSEDFWPARSVVKDFFGDAWVCVSDRTAGPERPAGRPASRSGEGAFAKADALTDAGDHAAAAELLERQLREQPGLERAGALLRLGRAHHRLGDSRAARHTWKYLLDGHPSSEACLELGRLERREDDVRLARGYILQGLAIARREGDPLEALVDELLLLPFPG